MRLLTDLTRARTVVTWTLEVKESAEPSDFPPRSWDWVARPMASLNRPGSGPSLSVTEQQRLCLQEGSGCAATKEAALEAAQEWATAQVRRGERQLRTRESVLFDVELLEPTE